MRLPKFQQGQRTLSYILYPLQTESAFLSSFINGNFADRIKDADLLLETHRERLVLYHVITQERSNLLVSGARGISSCKPLVSSAAGN